MDSIPTRLRRLREQNGISSGAELARLAGVPEATYRAYEAGRRPLTPRAARELAGPLGVTWQQLMFGEDTTDVVASAATTPEQASALLGMRVSRKPRPSRLTPTAALPAELVAMGGDSWALLPVYDARTSAGPAGVNGAAPVRYRSAFREAWVRSVTAAPLDQLAVIAIDGDSMEPTLCQGDAVLVDFAQNQPQRNDGIYVIRVEGWLQVKRVQLQLGTNRLTILSDNNRYEPQRDVRPDKVAVLGRVIWLGRQLGSERGPE